MRVINNVYHPIHPISNTKLDINNNNTARSTSGR